MSMSNAERQRAFRTRKRKEREPVREAVEFISQFLIEHPTKVTQFNMMIRRWAKDVRDARRP